MDAFPECFPSGVDEQTILKIGNSLELKIIFFNLWQSLLI